MISLVLNLLLVLYLPFLNDASLIAPDKPIVNQIQTFCFDSENPAMVGDLQINSPLNGNTLVWYSATAGGTPLPPSTLLEDQKKYYAALINDLGEESARTETKAFLLNPIFDAPDAVCFGDAAKISITNIPSTPQDFIQAHPELTLFLEDPINKTAYFLKEESMTWTAAYNYIQSFGESAAMYVINSKSEEDMVYNALLAVRINGQPIAGTDAYHFWLGLRQIEGEKPNNAVDKDWFWLDGRPLTDDLANWTDGEPNDFSVNSIYIEEGNEDYGQFDFYTSKTWNDINNSIGSGQSWPVFEFNGSTTVRWGSYDSNGDEILYDETSSTLTLNLTETTTFFIEVETDGVICRREQVVEVLPLPIIHPLPDLTFCDNDADGDDTNGQIQGIDLTVQNASALGSTQSASAYTVQYYPTENDAAKGQNEILGLYNYIPDADYVPSTLTTKVLFLKLTNNTTGCFTIDSFKVIITPLPQANPIADQYACDDIESGSDLDGIVTSWDFRPLNESILGIQDPDQFTVTYHLSQEDANDLGSPGITFPFSNTLTNTQPIYVRVTHNETQCFRATTSFNLVVNPLPVLLNTDIVHEQCDDDELNDGISLFNLHSWESVFSDNYERETFEFYKTSDYDPSGLIENDSIYYNEAFEETLYVRIISNAGCSRNGTITLRVAASLIPDGFMREYLICDDTDPFDQKGTAAFPGSILDNLKADLIATDVKFSLQDVTIDFFLSQEEALTTSNPLQSTLPIQTRTPYNQEIWALITNENVNTITCLGLKQVATLFVDPIPIPYPIQIDRQCDGDSTMDTDPLDGVFPFETATVNQQALQGQEGVTLFFYDANGDFIGNVFPDSFSSGSQFISVIFEKETANPGLTRINLDHCSTETRFELKVDAMPFLPEPISLRECDNGTSTTDGIAIFNTSGIHEQLVNGQNSMEILYLDELSGESFSVFPDSFETTTRTVSVFLKNPENENCTAYTKLNFTVDQLPVFKVEESVTLCQNIGNTTIGLTATDGREYTYSWSYTNANGNQEIVIETSPRIYITKAGIYNLTLTTQGPNSCSRTMSIEVRSSNIASVAYEDLIITDLQYGNGNALTLNTASLGIGAYEYSLDDGGYQDDPYFDSLSPGIHTLYINDKNGCGAVAIEFSVIGFYRFFTPNSDGYNDYWNVFGISPKFQPNSTVFIFDRLGKLIAQIDPMTEGWDGTLNGNPLPDTDYWFRLQLEDGRTAKGHFSLIRGY